VSCVEELTEDLPCCGQRNKVTPFKLGVVLSKQVKLNAAVNAGVSNRDVVSRRIHLVEIHETLRQSEQDMGVATVRTKHHRNGKVWVKPVKEPVQLFACLNLDWRLAL